MKRRYHVCVPISVGLEKLYRGENIFTGTIHEAIHDLEKARDEGKTFYTGCDNVSAEGVCQGHIVQW